MQLRIERTRSERMTDLVVLRFPGHGARFISFKPADWKTLCPEVQLGRGEAVTLEMHLEQVPANPFDVPLTNG